MKNRIKQINIILCSFLCVLLLLPVNCKKYDKKPVQKKNKAIKLAIITNLNGIIEPCGCTSKPLGGLDKSAAKIVSHQKNSSLIFLLNGNIFYEKNKKNSENHKEQNKKALTIAHILSKLDPNAIVVGENDTSWNQLEHIRKKYPDLPLFNYRKNAITKTGIDVKIHSINDLKIGIIGSIDTSQNTPKDYSLKAMELRKKGISFLVLLLPLSSNVAKNYAKNLEGFDIIIGGGGEHILEPEKIGESLYIEAGDKGRYIGLLSFHNTHLWNPTQKWFYDDENRSLKKSLHARIERLENRIDKMAQGKSRDIREKKLLTLKFKLKNISIKEPSSPYIRWETETITKKMKSIDFAKNILVDYNRSLCDISLHSTKNLECVKVDFPKDAYVGTEKCGTCHPDALNFYKKTKHAHAWKTLTNAGKECDLSCIGCHTVGYQKPGGYCKLEDAKKHANVGCENCHGPGFGHAKYPFDKNAQSTLFGRNKTADTCIKCHNKEHSDLFNFVTYLPKILGHGHGLPLPTKK